ncbi:MAG: alcohol dehydrogenase catalytic domain-containing protein [Oscillospiraceae bacterium]
MEEKKTMKAAVLKNFHEPFVVEELPIPKPKAGEVLVKVKASGLCLTDVHIQDGVLKTVKPPYTPGHELAGIVVELGEGVTNVKVGQHMCGWIDVVCHECAMCRMGRENLCLNRVRIGFERDGSHAEYVAIPAENVMPIAEDVPWPNAAVIPDAVACMYNAVAVQGKVKEGDRVLIAGMGALGVQGVQIAKHLGAKVYVSGRTPAKLDLALKFGADGVVNTREEKLQDGIERLTDGQLCDVTVDLIGTSSSIDEQLKCLRPGGKVIAAAYAADTFTVNYQEVVLKEKEIIGMRGSTPRALKEAIRLVEQKVIDPHVCKYWSIDEVNEAIDALRNFKNLSRTAFVFED